MSFSCKGCQLRQPGCHDKCQKYQAERKARDELNAIRQKHDWLQANLYQQRDEGVRRALKKDRRGRKGFGK